MKTFTAYAGIYIIELRLTRNDVLNCSHSGNCENDVKDVMKKAYVKKQLTTIDKEQLNKELKEYGAWDEIELANHQDNLMRFVWLMANDIKENQL